MHTPTAQVAEITWEDLLRVLEERPEWLARVRQVVLPPELLSLPEAIRELRDAQYQTTLQIQELVEVQRRHEERLTSVEARLDRLEATVQELVEAQRQTTLQIQELREAQQQTNLQIQAVWEAIQRNTAQLKDLTEVAQILTEGLRRLEGTVGDIKGTLLEMKYREQPYAYFGHVLRKVQVVPLRTVEDDLEAHLAWEEVKEVFRLDLLLKGRLRDHPEHPEVWLAVEVSSVVDRGDVARAGRRAALLRKAGFPTIPVAAGLGVDEEAQREAQWDKVVVVKDGQVFFWDEALRHYFLEGR